MKQRDIARRLEALEQQAQPERGGYVVIIDDDPSSLITVDGVDMTLAEYQRRYPGAVVVDIGGPSDATHAA